MAKGKKALFTFIIEILNGDGPKPGSFWIVLKKHHCHSPKKPKDPEEKTPGPQDKTPMVSHEALADVQKPVAGGKDVMTGVMPSAPMNLPQPPSSSLLSAHPPRHLLYVNTFLSANPFPTGHDMASADQWKVKAIAAGILCTVIGQIAKEAGQTGIKLKFF
jgi:hypothetical protein